MKCKPQIVVWEGCVVGDQKAQFIDFMKENGFTAKYVTEVKTNPTPGESGTGNRNDFFFSISKNDIMKFAIWRLQFGMRWFEDVVANAPYLYNRDVIDKYYSWDNKDQVMEAL